jgi:hypothetical protein
MALEPKRYTHVPVYVEAVQVTADNMYEVSKWCGGRIHKAGDNKFVKVDVPSPKLIRHTQAFIGDWVLKTDHGWKIYTPKAFESTFTLVEDGFAVI